MNRAIVAVALGVLAAACGGPDTPQAPQSKFDGVVGSVSKGPLQGATVNFYQVDVAGNLSGTTLATVSTDSSGRFSVTGLPSGVPILVQTGGGSYLDESDPHPDLAQRRRIVFGANEGLEAVLPVGASTLAITPYSMALLQKARTQAAGANFAAVYAAVHQQAQAAFGFDPILTQPADPITGAGGSQAYGILLGAAALTINQIAVTGTPEHLPGYADVIAFVNDFADGQLTAANLDDMIRRFRNNNIGVYGGVSAPTVDQAALSQPAAVQNTPPTLSSIANQTISEDTSTGGLSFTVGDAETAVESLTLSGSSSNAALVPDTNIAFGGSGASRTVTVTPAGNGSGTATITVTVTDTDGGSAATAFVLTVTGVNDAPVATNDSYTTSVNTTLTIAAPGVLSNDTDPDGTTPTANAASGTTAQLGSFTLNADGSFVYTPPSSTFTGADSFTYTATDGTNTTNVATVSIGVAANTGPTISSIPDQTINEDTSTGALAFTVGDAETPATALTVFGSSSDITLVTDSNIVFSGTGASRTVTVTPVVNKSGTVTITVTVTDSGGLSTSDLFFLTINAVADPPVANSNAYSTPVNTTLTIAAPGVLSNDTDPDGTTPTATPGPVTTAQGVTVTLNADGSFTYTPPAAFSGSDTFTYTATDGALTSSAATVTINVTPGPAFTYLPYSVDAAQGGGEFVVKSTDFAPPASPITVVITGSAAPTSIDRVTSSNVVLKADKTIDTIFADRLVWIENGQLFYSGLRDGDSPTVVTRFSSEAAATTSCQVNVVEMDFDSSRDAWFFYQLPGADTFCFTADDMTKAAKLSFGTAGGPGSDPITLPPGNNAFLTSFFAPSDLRALGFLVVDAGNLALYDANLQPSGPALITGGITSARQLHGDFNQALILLNDSDGRIVSVSDVAAPVPSITTTPVYAPQAGFANNCGTSEDATDYYVCEDRFSPPAGRITKIPKTATNAAGNLIVHDTTISTIFLQGLTSNKIVWQSSNQLLMLNKSGTLPLDSLTTNLGPGGVLLGAQRIFFTEGAGANAYAAVGKDETNAQIFSGGTGSAWVGLGAQIVGQTTSGFVADQAVRGLVVQGFSSFDTTGVLGGTLKSVDLTTPTVSVPATSITTFASSTTDNRDLFIFVDAPTFTGLGALCEKSPGTDCDIVAIDASATPRYQRVTATPTVSENPTGSK